MRLRPIVIIALLAMVSCSGNGPRSFSRKEKALINGSDALMRVLTIEDREDSLILRSKCSDIAAMDIQTKTYSRLEQLMKNTVVAADGVGIAGPQVGLLRRVVAVQRFDKDGEPFEVYPNIKIIMTEGEMEPGPEGCLSIPGRRGNVMRYRYVTIRYTSPVTLKDTVENVEGYSAIIFQHECDHLDGVLYIDKCIGF